MVTTKQHTIQPKQPTQQVSNQASTPDIRSLIESSYNICLCDGNKGGVGKSFFARALYHYLQTKDLSVMGVEADTHSPDFAGVIKEGVEVIEFIEDDSKLDSPNLLFDLLQEQQHSVVNLRASCHSAFMKWNSAFDAVSVLRQCNGRMIKFFVITGEYDSLQSLHISLSDLGDSIPHVVVKNMKYSDWDYYSNDRSLQSKIKAHHCPVIELPKLPTRVASFLLQKRLSLSKALLYKADRSKDERFGILEQSSIRKFTREFGTAMDQIWGQL